MAIFTSLSRRLLIEAARGRYEGLPPTDWDGLAEAAGVRASSRRVNRALHHLADTGLIEGVRTPDGWLEVRATTRGIKSAGRAARKPRPTPPVPALASLPPAAALPVLPAPAADPSAPRLAAIPSSSSAASRLRDGYLAADARAAAGVGRLRRSLPPRVASLRGQLAGAWHTLTTFP